jgi:aldehyde:ferredoxin oxidoreductase
VGDRKAYEGKAQMCIYNENLKGVLDSLGVCVFQTIYAGGLHYTDLSELAELLTAATGRALSVSQLTLIGERIHNIEKAFNAREGITRKDDYPPQRFFEPIPSGPGKGECWDREKLDRLLDEYYTLRGWDAVTGLPKRSTLRRLGLQAIADELKLDSN